MQTLKTLIAAALALLIPVETVSALPYSASTPKFHITLPSSLGHVTESWSPSASKMSSTKPDIILIQDLHANRSVQFAISGILKKLKAQGLMPDRIAVEGEIGPVDIASMQNYPDRAARNKASDYLVQQAEMPGAMHYAVTQGGVGLFGIETEEYYKANLEMFRRSYKGRAALREEIGKIQAVLPRLKLDAGAQANAAILEKDVEAVSRLINNQVIPDELPATLAQASQAVDHLQPFLSEETASDIIEPLKASVNFYALALLRNDEMFKNAMAVRELGRQKTTIAVTGGFHTQALAQECKRRGLSYAVITPNVRRHTKIDEQLYVERLLDHHLTPAQAATGMDWANAMTMIQFEEHAASIFPSIARSSSALRRFLTPLRVTSAAAIVACAMGVSGCKRIGITDPDGPIPTEPVPVQGEVLSNNFNSGNWIVGTRYTIYQNSPPGGWEIIQGDEIMLVNSSVRSIDPNIRYLSQLRTQGASLTDNLSEIGLNKTDVNSAGPAIFPKYEAETKFLVNSAFGLDGTKRVTQVDIHAGQVAFNVPLNASVEVHLIPTRMELIRHRSAGLKPSFATPFALGTTILDALRPTLHAATSITTSKVLYDASWALPLKSVGSGRTIQAEISASRLTEAANSFSLNLEALEPNALKDVEIHVNQGDEELTPIKDKVAASPTSLHLQLTLPPSTPSSEPVKVTVQPKGPIRGSVYLPRNVVRAIFSFALIALVAAGFGLAGEVPLDAMEKAPLLIQPASSLGPVAFWLGFGASVASVMAIVAGVFASLGNWQDRRSKLIARYHSLLTTLRSIHFSRLATNSGLIFKIPLGYVKSAALIMIQFQLRRQLADMAAAAKDSALTAIAA